MPIVRYQLRPGQESLDARYFVSDSEEQQSKMLYLTFNLLSLNTQLQKTSRESKTGNLPKAFETTSCGNTM